MFNILMNLYMRFFSSLSHIATPVFASMRYSLDKKKHMNLCKYLFFIKKGLSVFRKHLGLFKKRH